ncbi:MAG: aminotransferase class V-fold PLP-dependent enzyme, partial [Sarcina sp.]
MNNRDFYKDFPTLSEKDGKRVIYLDSGATTQKPVSVIEAVDKYYREQN